MINNNKIVCSIGNLTGHKNIPYLIDVAENINLEYFKCLGNDLVTLDVSQNLYLETLICSSNESNNLL